MWLHAPSRYLHAIREGLVLRRAVRMVARFMENAAFHAGPEPTRAATRMEAATALRMEANCCEKEE